MLDIKLIRESPDVYKDTLKRRHDKAKLKLLEELIKKDKKVRKLKFDIDKMKAQRNKISKEIGELKKNKKSATKKMKEASTIPKKIKKNEEEINKLDERIKFILMRLPNLLHESVPYGKDESENVQIRKWGKKPKFGFTPKNHLELLQNLDLIDSERASKIAGHGFYYSKEELVLLDMALIRFTIDILRKKGYILVNPPYMMRTKPYEGVTDLEEFKTVQYKVEDEDLRLISTSEHPLAAMFMDEVIDKNSLPLKFIGVSPNFRKEVGTHGKYTKGLFRMHQFHKIEMFVFSSPEDSWDLHEQLQKDCEEVYQKLEIPYRVVNVCTGDIGIVAAKKYDLEGMMGDGAYREIGSNSNAVDFQARRLNIKYREKEGQKPKGFVHTLNNTGLATSRAMVCLIENHQQKDGTVKIPKALWKYTKFKTIKPKKG